MVVYSRIRFAPLYSNNQEPEETGYMLHLNRETVGWFFMRDLQLDWRLAAEWFESRLLDHDCVLNWGTLDAF